MEVNLVCIGDSITYGYGVEANQCWVGILREKYGRGIFNAGINGDTTAGMLGRFDIHVIKGNPKYVFIMGGANDIIQERPVNQVTANIKEMIQLAQAHDIMPFIGIHPNPSSEDVPKEWKTMTDYDYVKSATFYLRDWISDYCTENGVHYVDFDAELKKRLQGRYRRYFLDGVHPDANGHRMMASIAEEFFIKNNVLTADKNVKRFMEGTEDGKSE